MSAYDVDLDELGVTVAALVACQEEILALAGDVDRATDGLHASWAGAAADAHSVGHTRWREDCGAMVGALARLRTIAAAAEEHYREAISANLVAWQQVAP